MSFQTSLVALIAFLFLITLSSTQRTPALTPTPLAPFETPRILLKNDPFSCPVVTPSNGTVNVRNLRFSDVSAVFAFGDSISAGFGMKSSHFATSFFEYRGAAASSGGDDGEVTLPNLFKIVRGGNELKGAAKGREFPWDAITWKSKIVRPHYPPVDHLNAARSNGRVKELPLQLAYILSQMKDEGVTEQDWKIATILIGANDLCVSCDGRKESTPEVYGSLVRTTLDQLHKNVPRVYVNLVPLFNISQVYALGIQSTYCSAVFKLVTECPCMTHHGVEGREYMDNLAPKYNEQLRQIADEWEAKQLDDFRVVYHPFTASLKIDDEKILSDLDCFHPSLLSNQMLAVTLFNSMQVPASKKPTHVDFEHIQVNCPTEDTYLQ